LDFEDVMGVLTRVGIKRELQRNEKTIKLNVICLEA